MCADRRSNPPADIGRNDPCPCGSGKKYKKCCMARDAAAEATPSSTAWQDVGARSATMPGAGLNIHPYALVKMVTNPSPDLLSRLSKRDVAALKDKWSIAKVASFETPEIVWRLEQLGIDAHPPAFAGLTAGRSSAWSVGKAWVDGMSSPLDQDEDDFICLAACELWKRYCPERPSMEMVDDWVTEGYDLSEAGKEDEAADVWWRAWDHVRSTLQPHMAYVNEIKGVRMQFVGKAVVEGVTRVDAVRRGKTYTYWRASRMHHGRPKYNTFSTKEKAEAWRPMTKKLEPLSPEAIAAFDRMFGF